MTEAAREGALLERYHEILTYRAEGLAKYGARFVGQMRKAPARMSFPTISFAPPAPGLSSAKAGPFYARDNPPIADLARGIVAGARDGCTILEIGPGSGTVAGDLRHRFPDKIAAYYGLELDPTARGPYERIDGVSAIPGAIDLVIASEVVEHMSYDAFFGEMMGAIAPRLSTDAAMVVGTPNPLAPGAIFRDFSHVQGYAWYDLYALMRLYFDRVDAYRTWYAWTPWKIFWLPLAVGLAPALELDWCEGVACVGRGSRMAGPPEG